MASLDFRQQGVAEWESCLEWCVVRYRLRRRRNSFLPFISCTALSTNFILLAADLLITAYMIPWQRFYESSLFLSALVPILLSAAVIFQVVMIYLVFKYLAEWKGQQTLRAFFKVFSPPKRFEIRLGSGRRSASNWQKASLSQASLAAHATHNSCF